MKEVFNHILEEISVKTSSIDIDGCDISTEEALSVIEFIQVSLENLREKSLSCKSINAQDEIYFFKDLKPQILSRLLYFNKIYTIELKRPNGSNVIHKNHYEKELDIELTTSIETWIFINIIIRIFAV
ncbi:MAG: hypothetical protein EOM29_08040 [Bacteroidia bacterium]|nr:hypothetical protein [Bacteroidia bacterium]